MNYWLFGAGKWGAQYVVENGKEQIKGFIDNSADKHGTLLCEIPIFSYDDFKKRFDKKAEGIIITTRFYDDCYNQLQNDLLDKYVVGGGGRNGILLSYEDFNAQRCFSQLGEDLVIKPYFSWNYGTDYKGVYVDVGCYHPYRLSNTTWAYKSGWRGINIDANPQTIELFNKYRPNDININCGVSDENGILKYYMYKEASLNTFDSNLIDRSNVIGVKDIQVRRLEDIFEEYHITDIDFMDIDVEGLDERILASFDYKKYAPKMIMLEQYLTEGRIFTDPIGKILRENGYMLFSFNFLNSIYVKEPLKSK